MSTALESAPALAPEEFDLLHDLLSVPSPTGEEAPAVQLLTQRMSAMGLDSHIDEAGNAVGKFSPPSALAGDIVLLGHIDTAPGYWEPVVAGGRIHARGAVDAKGPLAALTLATARCARAGTLRRRVHVIGAVEEESVTSRGANHVALTHDPAYCIIGEPAGVAGVTLGYKGRLMCRVRVVTPEHHSSRPEPNATELAIGFWARISAMARRRSRGCGIFDSLNAHLLHFQSGSDGLESRAEMVVSFRLPPAVVAARLRRWLERHVPSGGVLEFPGGEPAVRGSRAGPLPTAFAHALHARGLRPVWKLKGGTSDMNVVIPRWGCPSVAYGPGDSALDHTPEEALDLDEFALSIRVLEDVLPRL